MNAFIGDDQESDISITNLSVQVSDIIKLIFLVIAVFAKYASISLYKYFMPSLIIDDTGVAYPSGLPYCPPLKVFILRLGEDCYF